MSELVITPANVMPSAEADIYVLGVADIETTAGEFVVLATPPSADILKVYAGFPPTGAGLGFTRGISLNHAYAGQIIAVALKDPAFEPGATLVKGETYWSSAANPGKIIPTGDLTGSDYRIRVGTAASTTILVLDPGTTDATG